jgi:epoxide hydrolase-like predicted phosphatase
MIKAIIFDLGGVLFTHGMTLFTQYIADKHGKEQKAVLKLLKESDLLDAYYVGKMYRDDFYAVLNKELHIDDDANELEQKLFDVYQIVEETEKIVKQLRKKYKVYFLSDNFKERVEDANKKYGFIQWFDGGVFSHVVGVKKPNQRIYELAIKEIGLKPKEMLFIDDKEINLPPAEKLGMKTLLYKNSRQLEDDLTIMKLL